MSKDDWEVIDTVRNAEGVKAVITRKKTGVPRYAVAFFKFFTPSHSSEERDTIYIDAERLSSVGEVVRVAQDRVSALILDDLKTTTDRVNSAGAATKGRVTVETKKRFTPGNKTRRKE